jgi:trimethylamine--corrinoid protein Co-methyltransferase
MEDLAGSLKVLNDDEIKAIHSGSLKILEDTGVEIPNNPLLEDLSQSGLKVDFKKGRVFFRADVVEKAVKTAPSSFTWHARHPKYTLEVGYDKVHYGLASTISTVVDLDGVRRPATKEDAKRLSLLTNKLEFISDAYCGVWPTDVPERSEHVHIMYAQLTQSEKPCRGRLHGLKQAKDCIAMAEIVAGGSKELREKPNLMALY